VGTGELAAKERIERKEKQGSLTADAAYGHRAAEPQPRQESGKKMGAKNSVNPESWGTGELAAKKRKTRKGKNTRRP
jgi:hypothetical protein